MRGKHRKPRAGFVVADWLHEHNLHVSPRADGVLAQEYGPDETRVGRARDARFITS